MGQKLQQIEEPSMSLTSIESTSFHQTFTNSFRTKNDTTNLPNFGKISLVSAKHSGGNFSSIRSLEKINRIEMNEIMPLSQKVRKGMRDKSRGHQNSDLLPDQAEDPSRANNVSLSIQSMLSPAKQEKDVIDINLQSLVQMQVILQNLSNCKEKAEITNLVDNWWTLVVSEGNEVPFFTSYRNSLRLCFNALVEEQLIISLVL